MKSQSTEVPQVPEVPQLHRPLPTEWQEAIDSFLEFRRVHRGVSTSTLRGYRTLLRQFAEHLSPPGASVLLPGAIEACHIDRFLLGGLTLGRFWARRAAATLRLFLRYLALLGEVPADLGSQVACPRTYRLAGLPRGMEPSDLRRVLRAVRRRDPEGRRDYAILVVFATYGLRVSDVAALRLDDIHWRDGTIEIQVVKTGRPLILPLTDSVGDALAEYLQHGRPPCDHREVFLARRKLVVPLTRRSITKIVRQAMDRAGVKLRHVATHAFRHSFATRLVRNGVALGTVADCLGHASSKTTFIYTKLAVEDLRSVSLDPREVIR
jgi:integrase/recombinase XerD